jgi:hypothetical protein
MSYRILSVMKRYRGLGSRSSDPTHTKAGYKPVFANDHSGYQYNMQDNTFDHLPHMQLTMRQLEACSPGHVVRLFDYSISGSHDTETHLSDYSETQAPEDLHDAQPEDELATQVLGPHQIRTISKYIFL